MLVSIDDPYNCFIRLTLNPDDWTILISAGTRSPDLTFTMSPTTKFSTSRVIYLPPLKTVVSYRGNRGYVYNLPMEVGVGVAWVEVVWVEVEAAWVEVGVARIKKDACIPHPYIFVKLLTGQRNRDGVCNHMLTCLSTSNKDLVPGIYVRRKVQIRTILGFSCGSYLRATILGLCKQTLYALSSPQSFAPRGSLA